MQRAFNSIFFSTLPLATLGCFIPLSTTAQVTPDNTTSTRVNQDGNNFTIEQGNRVGDNLFHSFNQFSVPTLGSVAFNNAADIANIFSRVTGSSISSIDGLISANGTANLFLINPNGIIFGKNASLNLGGSFFASTADSLLFEGNTEFSAVNPQAPPLLEVSIPIGLNFRDNPRDITVLSKSTPEAPFILPTEAKLVFIGGNVSFEGAEINALGRTVELGGLVAAGTVTLNDDLNLGFPENITKADVFLNNGAFIDVSSGGGGNININARNFELTQSALFAGIRPNAGNLQAQAGDININATGEVNLRQASSINNSVYIDGTGNSGDININTGSLNLTQGGEISSITAGQGNAGAIFIDASNNILIDGTTPDGFVSGIFNKIQTDGVGNGGEININATNLSITNGALIDATIIGKGNGGSITINANDSISIDGRSPDGFTSGIANRVETSGVGNAGTINITTTDLSLTNDVTITTAIRGNGNAGEIDISTKNLSIDKGSQINSSTFGQGNAGDINIIASDSILVDGIGDDGFVSSISSSVADTVAVGNSGEVNINTTNLSLTNEGVIDVSTFGQGNAGKISITAETIQLDNGDIFSSPASTAEGDAGIIEINTTNLNLTNGGLISSSTFGQGNAGGIKIAATNTISAEGTDSEGFSSGIFSTVDETAQGDAGGIEIATGNLTLTNGSQIDASTFGKGNASLVKINAIDSISADGTNSGIFSIVGETATGDAGGIEIATGNLTLTDGGAIDASTVGKGNAGGINITATDISADGESQEGFSSGIFSTVNQQAEGDAGRIDITTTNLNLTNSGTVNAITFGEGDAGAIKITAFDTISVDGKDNEITLTGIYSTVENTAIGNASGIQIDTLNLNLTNTGQISSSTFGKGNAGKVKIAANTIFADGERNKTISGIFSRVDETAEGNAGGIEVTAKNLTLSNEAEINVGIFGQTNPEIESGNLNLTVQDFLILKNSGRISAQATGNNNGGNVTINANDGLIIAFPNQNNDIFANAAQGNGGNINIFTQAIFGLEERRSTPPNQTNDIDASSEFGLQGTFSLNTPDIDPTSGLIELPQAVGDASDQISQNPCEQGIGSEFIITGKGGLPPNVNESLNSESAQVGLIEAVPSQPQTVEGNNIQPNPSTTSEAVPAQGWIFNAKGEVTLTAYSTSGNQIQRSRQQHSNTCSSGIEP